MITHKHKLLCKLGPQTLQAARPELTDLELLITKCVFLCTSFKVEILCDNRVLPILLGIFSNIPSPPKKIQNQTI